MSTFNGIVDEFPTIRIDYFRYHSDKPPPQACFLSHVHSDHLQGLETLKMPFVYCSAATKNILLRMEKYPHRINFAKGILEARKQTYKALKLVLRALPLETPVEIELGPKSKIRVTLFDANHCPGAVMFLIEGSEKSVLYTGDVRAESWWVNSIIRNPILLPYTCGAETLDCIYLDTTFASRSNIYEHFPSQADGIKELLTKVGKVPGHSIFYFRSWTLGYEDVWIALSNFLQTRVHVDDYQLRMFKALTNDTDKTDRGPALVGFTFGNQYHFGCLTDGNAARIHSCEPGTECFDQIRKQEDVVWITPIISRLKDGTEIPEVGAGGGGGDLYQTPQLENVDEVTLQTLQKLCTNSSKHDDAIAWLGDAIVAARNRGGSNISLEGLGLDQQEEVSLKHFVQLISRRDELATKNSKRTQHKIIHFPYSRHSSFSELRHLVASFRPRDICPCTVDIEKWTEDVSMQSLFGDLCNGDTFRHDHEVRARFEEKMEFRGTKRKRGDTTEDSQETQSQSSTQQDEIYKSAETSLKKSNSQAQDHIQQVEQNTRPPCPKVPTPVRKLHEELSNKFERSPVAINQPQELITEAIAINSNLVQLSTPANPPSMTERSNDPKNNFLQYPLDLSVDEIEGENQGTNSPPASVFQSMDQTESSARGDQIDDRVGPRRTAYDAAKVVLQKHDNSAWDELRLRSIGWKGHTEEETIL